jgi:CheY-like chemotaxis protein
MRVVVTRANQEFARFVSAVEQDATSWDGWNCLYIRIEPKRTFEQHISPMGLMISEFGHYYEKIDGVAYVLAGNHMFLITRHITKHQLRNLANDLAYALLAKFSIASTHRLYEVAHDWKLLRNYCDDLGCWKAIDGEEEERADETQLPQYVNVHDLRSLLEKNMLHRNLRNPVTILLVEADPFASKLVSRILRDDYKLVTAYSAETAIMQYMMHAPHIVFLDIGLPDHSGFSVMKTIRAYDPDAYFVMFSGNSFAENITRSILSGARGFIEKPFRRERLLHYIDDYRTNHRPDMSM